MLHCNRCGSELTAPQFFEGKVYGYECINHVNPGFKKQKNKYVKCSSYEILSEQGVRKVFKISVNDTVYKNVMYGDSDQGRGYVIQDGTFYISEKFLPKR